MKTSALHSYLTGLTVFLGATAGIAQTAPPITSSIPENAVVLSPFAVTSDKDNGYAATETLAGTRMRTNLRDVGAALTILTPEFLQDLAVTSIEQGLLYTPSVDSFQGNNNDNGTQLRYSSGQTYTIRGFASNEGGQAISHDFFTALDATDNYNLERITLALGPNSMLIGVGSPQGVAVTTTKRAQLQRQKSSVQTQYDSWGSNRMSLDHNQPLVRDQLAFRLNLLHDQKREFRRYEGQNQDRLTLGVTYKPFANTTVTVNHESYNIHRNVSPLIVPWDGALLRWAAAGKPTVNFLSSGQSWTTTRPYVDASGKAVLAAPGVTTVDGYVHKQSDFDPNSDLYVNTSQTPTYVVGLSLPNPMINMRYQALMQPAIFGGSANSSAGSKDPWALLGIPKDANLNAGSWATPNQKEHGRWSTYAIEQKLADGLYLSAAGNLARFAKDFDTDSYYPISLDVNRYLPDGTLNPGYLVPYSQTSAQQRSVLTQLQQNRMELSYQLDLTNKSRWLGKHNFGLLYQRDRTDNDQDVLNLYNRATVGLPTSAGWSTDALASSNLLNARVYFLNGNVPSLPSRQSLLKMVGQIDGYGKMVGATANETAPMDFALESFINAIKGRSTDESRSLGWQSSWLNDHLVTLFGYRVDGTKVYSDPTMRAGIDPAVTGSSTVALSRYYTPSQQMSLNANPDTESRGISRTFGGVYHAFSWLSFTYNQSANFSPVTTPGWVDALGRPAPNSVGKTYDYGLRFSLLNDRLSIGLSRFETTASNQARNSNGYIGGARNIIARLRADFAADSHFTDLPTLGGLPVDSGNAADTWNFKATGYELNMVFNPSRNWRIGLSGSTNENVLGTHLQSTGEWLNTAQKFQGIPTWSNFATELEKVAAGQASNSFDLNPKDPVAQSLAAADALYIRQQITAQQNTYNNERALEGVTTSRNGKYGVNGLATYMFGQETFLKGWSVGGNFRWRSPNTIGYQRLADAKGAPTGILDVSKAVKGTDWWECGALLAYERRVFAKSKLRVQLNVTNLFNFNAVRAVSADYDTNGVLGSVNSETSYRWELRRPRNYVLTTTIDI